MGKFALYTIGFALLACVPAILLAGMFSGGGGDVAPFLLGMLAVGAVLAGAVCLKDKLDRMEETLKAVSKTLQEVKTELETVKGISKINPLSYQVEAMIAIIYTFLAVFCIVNSKKMHYNPRQ